MSDGFLIEPIAWSVPEGFPASLVPPGLLAQDAPSGLEVLLATATRRPKAADLAARGPSVAVAAPARCCWSPLTQPPRGDESLLALPRAAIRRSSPIWTICPVSRCSVDIGRTKLPDRPSDSFARWRASVQLSTA